MKKNDIELGPNEKLEDLQCEGLRILQNENLYRFTSDAVILANFAKARRGQRLLDIGTGSGIIPILMAKKTNFESAVGIEIQPALADMARRSVALNGLEGRIEILNKDAKRYVPQKQFDVVTCNPPYKRAGAGRKNENTSRRIARHEECLALERLCEVVRRCLKFGGSFYVCFDAWRVAELLYELKRHALEPKEMFFTAPREGAEPTIVFVRAVSGGRPDVRVRPTVITNDADGKYLEEVKKMRF